MSFRFTRGGLLASLVLFASSAPALPADPERELEEFQQKLLKKLLAGNTTPEELRGLVNEMNKLMLKQFPELEPLQFLNPEKLGDGAKFADQLQKMLANPDLRGPQFRQLPLPPLPQPPARVHPGGGRMVAPPLMEPAEPQPRVRPEAEKQLKEFDDAIERLKGNPEAQAELHKARDEFKKALEEGLKKEGFPPQVGEALPRPQARLPRLGEPAAPLPVPQLQQIEAPALPLPFPAFPRERAELVRPVGPVRLGVVFEKPADILVEQLDLPERVGVVVVDVQPGSAAEKAGLRKNDVIVKLGDQEAPSDLPRFQRLVANLPGQEKIEAVLFRKGKRTTLTLELPGVAER